MTSRAAMRSQAPAALTESGLDIDLENLAFSVDRGIGTRGNLGLIVLKSDHTIEAEFRELLPAQGVGLYHARIHNDTTITRETLLEMGRLIAPTTKLLPSGIDFQTIGFACTSGALVIGEEAVAREVHSVRPRAKVTDPVTAAVAALKAVGARRVALLTPYLREINLRMRTNFEARGVPIPVMGSFNQADDNVVASISPASVLDAIVRLGREESCDAVFVSCTSLRVAGIVAEAEAAIGKPVTSSNHALAWHMLRLAGIPDKAKRFGRLFAV